MSLQARISDQFQLWIREALLASSAEDVSWDVGLAALPDPAMTGQFIGFMLIEVEIPGEPATVDGEQTPTVIHTRGTLPPFAPRDQVHALVTALVADLYAARDTGPGSATDGVTWTAQTPGKGTPA